MIAAQVVNGGGQLPGWFFALIAVALLAVIFWPHPSRSTHGGRDRGPDVPSQPLGPSHVRPAAPSPLATPFELIAEGFVHGPPKWDARTERRVAERIASRR